MRVLVVEDQSSVARMLRRMLEEEGFAVDDADSIESGRVLAFVNDYDAIVLDLMLPDGNGISLVQALRREGRDTPILILTAETDEATTVRALDAGADDYTTKPVALDAFRARMRALVRRGGARRTEVISYGNVTLNRLTRELLVGTKPLRLTEREFRLIEHFLMHAGEVVTRTALLEKVLDMSFEPDTNVLDVSVARVRKKLTDAGASVGIASRRGVGFVLSAN